MQYAKGPLRYECDWDGQCTQVFATRDDLDRHWHEDHNPNDLPDPDGSNGLPIPDGPWFHLDHLDAKEN